MGSCWSFFLKLINLPSIINQSRMNYCQLRGGRSEAEYSPFQSPPNLARAVKHYRSTLVGASSITPDTHLCECCSGVIDKRRLALACHFTELGFLSASLALYFQVIKLAMGLLLVIVVPAFVACFLDLQEDGWSLPQLVFLGGRTLARQLLLLQAFLTVLSIYFINRCCRASAALIERTAPLPQPYTLQLLNLPQCSEEQLKIWIFNKFGEYPCSVIFAYDTKQLNDSFRRREELTIQLNRLLLVRRRSHGHFSPSLSATLLEEKDHTLTALREQIAKQDEILNKYNNYYSIPHDGFVGVAFVVLEHAEKCRDILSQRDEGLLGRLFPKCRKQAKLKYKESQIDFRAAPNPRDLIWSNLKPGQYKILLTYSVLFVGVNWLLGPAFIHVILMLHKLWPEQLLAVCLLFYLLYHLLVHLFITFFLDRLECSTFTRRALTSFYSYGIFNVLFPAALPYQLGLSATEAVEFIHALLLVDSLTHSAIKIFNVAKVYSRVYCEYINHLPPGSNPYTQSYFNRLMEGWQYKIGENYHYLFRGLCLCAFFARPAPLAAGFYLLSFAIQFWIQKYILLRKCKTPPKVSQALSDHFLVLLHFLPLAFLAGAYTFDLHFQQEEFLVGEWETGAALGCCLCLLWVRQSGEGGGGSPKCPYRQIQGQLTEFYEVENEINRFNGQLRHRCRAVLLRRSLHEQLQLTEDFFVEEQELQSEKMIEKQHHSLVDRLISYNIEMHSFQSPPVRSFAKIP